MAETAKTAEDSPLRLLEEALDDEYLALDLAKAADGTAIIRNRAGEAVQTLWSEEIRDSGDEEDLFFALAKAFDELRDEALDHPGEVLKTFPVGTAELHALLGRVCARLREIEADLGPAVATVIDRPIVLDAHAPMESSLQAADGVWIPAAAAARLKAKVREAEEMLADDTRQDWYEADDIFREVAEDLELIIDGTPLPGFAGAGPAAATGRIELETPLGTLSAYRSGDPGVYEDIAVDLIREDGALLQLATVTMDVSREEPDLRVLGWDGTQEDPAVSCEVRTDQSAYWYEASPAKQVSLDSILETAHQSALADSAAPKPSDHERSCEQR